MAASRAGVSSSPSSSSLSPDSESESSEPKSSVSASEPYFSLTAHDKKKRTSQRDAVRVKKSRGGWRAYASRVPRALCDIETLWHSDR